MKMKRMRIQILFKTPGNGAVMAVQKKKKTVSFSINERRVTFGDEDDVGSAATPGISNKLYCSLLGTGMM